MHNQEPETWPPLLMNTSDKVKSLNQGAGFEPQYAPCFLHLPRLARFWIFPSPPNLALLDSILHISSTVIYSDLSRAGRLELNGNLELMAYSISWYALVMA